VERRLPALSSAARSCSGLALDRLIYTLSTLADADKYRGFCGKGISTVAEATLGTLAGMKRHGHFSSRWTEVI
jgi:hypothetical protein